VAANHKLAIPDIGYSPTMPVLVRRAADLYGNSDFMVLGGDVLSFAEAERRSSVVARRLLALGLQKGGRVGLMLPNTLEWVVLLLGIGRAGGVAVLMSTLYKGREIAEVARQTDIDTLIIPDTYLGHDYVERAEQAFPLAGLDGGKPLFLSDAPHLRRIFVVGERAPHWAAGGMAELETAPPVPSDELLHQVEHAITPSDDLLIVNTSGSTAAPKSVLHTHGSVIRLSHAMVAMRGYKRTDRLWNSAPFFWLGGLNVGIFPALDIGMAYHIGTQKEPRAILEYVSSNGITFASTWPWEAAAVRKDPEYPVYRERMPSLWHGFENWLDGKGGQAVPDSRIPVLFGMTETFGPYIGECELAPLPPSKEGSIGRAMDGIEIKIVDPETGRDLGADQEGELWVRGYSLMVGYIKRERLDAFTADGWFPTGDRCRIDADGWVYTTGRMNDLIKIRGANVAPREVELVLSHRPEVREAVVLSVPDNDGIEQLVAVIIPSSGQTISEPELRDYCRQQLSAYKVPARIVVRADAEIPRTVSSKVIKRLVREDLLKREFRTAVG
jgi:acyl-CoA synthetase (AMP-forming)/AMP-acid ligase II